MLNSYCLNLHSKSDNHCDSCKEKNQKCNYIVISYQSIKYRRYQLLDFCKNRPNTWSTLPQRRNILNNEMITSISLSSISCIHTIMYTYILQTPVPSLSLSSNVLLGQWDTHCPSYNLYGSEHCMHLSAPIHCSQLLSSQGTHSPVDLSLYFLEKKD